MESTVQRSGSLSRLRASLVVSTRKSPSFSPLPCHSAGVRFHPAETWDRSGKNSSIHPRTSHRSITLAHSRGSQGPCTTGPARSRSMEPEGISHNAASSMTRAYISETKSSHSFLATTTRLRGARASSPKPGWSSPRRLLNGASPASKQPLCGSGDPDSTSASAACRALDRADLRAVLRTLVLPASNRAAAVRREGGGWPQGPPPAKEET